MRSARSPLLKEAGDLSSALTDAEGRLIAQGRDMDVLEVAERLHSLAAEAGGRHEILWDDRDESPGVKFTDAELLGMPWILTVSPRSLAAGGIEVTERATGERSTRSIEEVEALLVNGFVPAETAA